MLNMHSVMTQQLLLLLLSLLPLLMTPLLMTAPPDRHGLLSLGVEVLAVDSRDDCVDAVKDVVAFAAPGREPDEDDYPALEW